MQSFRFICVTWAPATFRHGQVVAEKDGEVKPEKATQRSSGLAVEWPSADEIPHEEVVKRPSGLVVERLVALTSLPWEVS